VTTPTAPNASAAQARVLVDELPRCVRADAELLQMLADDVARVTAVRARTGVAMAADESIRREHAGPELLRAAVDVAIVKP